jgi:hypothetical protein
MFLPFLFMEEKKMKITLAQNVKLAKSEMAAVENFCSKIDSKTVILSARRDKDNLYFVYATDTGTYKASIKVKETKQDKE